MTVLEGAALAPYRKAVYERICSVCNDQDVHGKCARDPSNPCALMDHLDLIVESILSVGGSPIIDDYVAALRKGACRHCREDEKGFCALRRFGECSADAYIVMVVDVIEEVARELGHGRFAKPAGQAAKS